MNISLRTAFAFSLLATAGSARATLVYYSTQATFLAAASNTSVDTFSDLTFASLTRINRTIGDDSYSITAPSAPGNTGKTSMLVAAESAGNPAVAVYYNGVPMLIGGFSSAGASTPVQAIGGNFFNVGSSATFVSGAVTLTAVDSDGLSLTRTLSPAYTARTGLVTSFEAS